MRRDSQDRRIGFVQRFRNRCGYPGAPGQPREDRSSRFRSCAPIRFGRQRFGRSLPQRKNQIWVRLEGVDAELVERAMRSEARKHEAREEPSATAGHRVCSPGTQAQLASDADEVRLASDSARTPDEVVSRRGRKEREPDILCGFSGAIYGGHCQVKHAI
jgi:hypothetical protein